jgi:hypothetical protein
MQGIGGPTDGGNTLVVTVGRSEGYDPKVEYADGMVPLDKWFGSFHDGSPQADEAMKARRQRMRQV